MRRGPVIVVGLLVLAGVLALAGRMLKPATRPSVVLITLDTVRADALGAYGRSPSITPNIDAFALRGVVFETAWTTCPLTVPAHASLLTGLAPPQHGLRSNHPAGRLPEATDTLAEAFRADGYATAAFVSASVLRADRTGLDAGFDLYDDVDPPPAGALHDTERRAQETVTAALDWVRNRPDPNQPVFLWVHLFDPHAPYAAPMPYGKGPKHTADAKGYDGEIEYTDHWVGELLDGLDAAGLGDAVVALTSDHGEGLGEHGEDTHGYLLHEATLRIPLIVSAPGQILPGARRSEPASAVDVAPTLCALAGLAVPARMAGRALPGREPPGTERWLYAETLYGWEGCRWSQMFAFRSSTRKVVDAGPHTLAFDLREDPREERPRKLPALPGPGSVEVADPAHVLVTGTLRPLAATPTVGALGAPPATGSPGYFSPLSSRTATVLERSDNAHLPSPYDRMDVLKLLQEGIAHLGSGSGALALASLDKAAALDPENPQIARWRARTLTALKLPREAEQAYRKAFELGWQHPDCVVKTLQACLQQGPGKAWERADEFLSQARGRGVPDVAATLVFEAALRIGQMDLVRARACVDQAATMPLDAWTKRALDQTTRRLEVLEDDLR